MYVGCTDLSGGVWMIELANFLEAAAVFLVRLPQVLLGELLRLWLQLDDLELVRVLLDVAAHGDLEATVLVRAAAPGHGVGGPWRLVGVNLFSLLAFFFRWH